MLVSELGRVLEERCIGLILARSPHSRHLPCGIVIFFESFAPLLQKIAELVVATLRLREAVGCQSWQRSFHRETQIHLALPRSPNTPFRTSDSGCRWGVFHRTGRAVASQRVATAKVQLHNIHPDTPIFTCLASCAGKRHSGGTISVKHIITCRGQWHCKLEVVMAKNHQMVIVSTP
jgi:hypothetical protein